MSVREVAANGGSSDVRFWKTEGADGTTEIGREAADLETFDEGRLLRTLVSEAVVL